MTRRLWKKESSADKGYIRLEILCLETMDYHEVRRAALIELLDGPHTASSKKRLNIFNRAPSNKAETLNNRAVNAMRSVLEALKGDVVRWRDADPVEKFNIEIELSQELKGLEAYGFYLFGVKRKIPRIFDKEKTQISMCTIYMSHSRSRKIVRDKNSNMVIPATLTEVVR
jgi:hypothetical protein